MEQMQHEDFYDASQRKNPKFGSREYFEKKWNVLRGYSQERFQLYDLALKLTALCQIKGLRMVMENPWHPTNFTNHFWFMRASVIDKDRTRRGDYFVKRKMKKKMDKDVVDKIFIDKKTENGVCDTERSMIHPDYARNFICDFILGKKQQHTLQTLF